MSLVFKDKLRNDSLFVFYAPQENFYNCFEGNIPTYSRKTSQTSLGFEALQSLKFLLAFQLRSFPSVCWKDFQASARKHSKLFLGSFPLLGYFSLLESFLSFCMGTIKTFSGMLSKSAWKDYLLGSFPSILWKAFQTSCGKLSKLFQRSFPSFF